MRLKLARNFFIAALAVAGLSCTGITPSRPVQTAAATPNAAIIRYNAIHHPVIARYGMVVTQNALATDVGRQILADGGNAVDAAVAIGFALAVTLPRAGNLGGSGFMLVHLAGSDETIALDYRSAAPAAATMDHFKLENGTTDREKLTFGPMAPAVPGTVAGMHEAWQRFGSMSWSALIAPALRLASQGIVVTEDLAYAMREAAPIVARYPGSADAYLKANGTSYTAGDLFLQPDLAWSLETLADDGAKAFYRGVIAERISNHMKAVGGLISREDLEAYRVKQRVPVTGSYRGHQVVAAPPVSSGGLTLVQMLKVLDHFSLGQMPAGSARSLHLIAEAMKRSAANRRMGLGDPDYVDVPRAGFVSDELADELAASIDVDAATPVTALQPVEAAKYESRETTHFSVMDRHGNAVSNTYTLGYSFGSGFVVPGTGILLDNQMRNFTYGKPGHANELAPGKRMLSTMTPTLVLNPNGEVMLVTGSPGGSRIINIVVQLIINVIDYGMNIAQATHAPRIHQQWRTPFLGVEPGTSRDTVNLLKLMGHQVVEQQTMGSAQSIMFRDGLFYGSADPRRPGALALGLDVVPAEKP